MINNCTLVGRLTKDVDLRYTPNGVPVATFTLAVGRPFSGQNGEKETDFLNVVVFRKQAENTANFLKKGSLTGVTGRIQTRNYEGQDGKRVYVTEIYAESVQFLEPKNQGALDTHQQQAPRPQNGFRNDQYVGAGQINIQDDDLPF